MADKFSNEDDANARFTIRGVLDNEGGQNADGSVEVSGDLVGSPYGYLGGKEEKIGDALGFRKDMFPLVDVPLKLDGQTDYHYRLDVEQRPDPQMGPFTRWNGGVYMTGESGTVRFNSPELLDRLEGSAWAGIQERLQQEGVALPNRDAVRRYAGDALREAGAYIEANPDRRFDASKVPLAEVPEEYRGAVRDALAAVEQGLDKKTLGDAAGLVRQGEAALEQALGDKKMQGLPGQWRREALEYGDRYEANYTRTALGAYVGVEKGTRFDPTPMRPNDAAEIYAGARVTGELNVLTATYKNDFGITAGANAGAEAYVGAGYQRENDPGRGGVRGTTGVSIEAGCGTDTGTHYIGGLESPATPDCRVEVGFKRTF